MPFNYQFTIAKKKFDHRTLTELQHKIRVPLKCYTITEFKMNDDQTFSFKKTVRKLISGNKITIIDKAVHHGSYAKEDFNEENYRITVTFYD